MTCLTRAGQHIILAQEPGIDGGIWVPSACPDCTVNQDCPYCQGTGHVLYHTRYGNGWGGNTWDTCHACTRSEVTA